MGIKVDRVGTFRCRLVEKAMGKTNVKEQDKNDPGGYPQLITRVQLTELYDEKGGEGGVPIWFPIEDWDMETVAYSCLYGFIKKSQAVGKTLTCGQIMKVFKWDGASLAELMAADHDGLEFQIRIGENNYEGSKYPFQVDWIDEYDADPVHTLKKLDAKEIKDLDAQFSTGKVASAKAAASAPKKPVKIPHPARVPADDETKPVTAADKKAIMKQKSERIKAAAKVVGTTVPTPPAPTSVTAPPLPEDEGPSEVTPAVPEAGGSCTKKEAWNKIFEMRDPTIDDDTVKELWGAAIEEVAGPDAKHQDITGEQWWQVKDIVIADCGKF